MYCYNIQLSADAPNSANNEKKTVKKTETAKDCDRAMLKKTILTRNYCCTHECHVMCHVMCHVTCHVMLCDDCYW